MRSAPRQLHAEGRGEWDDELETVILRPDRMTPKTEPIFKSVGQALFVAYAMEITGASPRGTMETVRHLLEERLWGAPARLAERTINIGDLTPLEFRAECARIRKFVTERLAPFERDATWARFGHAATKEQGIRGLHDYYRSICTIRNDSATLALMQSIYKPGARRRVPLPDPMGRGLQEYKRQVRTRDEWSLRKIEEEFGISRMTLQRQQASLRDLTHKLELRSQAKLEAHFLFIGLIEEAASA